MRTTLKNSTTIIVSTMDKSTQSLKEDQDSEYMSIHMEIYTLGAGRKIH